MRNLRFNIASLLGIVLFAAVSIAALRQADELWDSGLFTLTLCAMLVSILLAVHRSDARRAFSIGFALFGWGYMGLSLVLSIESRLITTKAIAYLDSKVPRSEAVGILAAAQNLEKSPVPDLVHGPAQDVLSDQSRDSVSTNQSR